MTARRFLPYSEECGLESRLFGWHPQRIARDCPTSLLIVRKDKTRALVEAREASEPDKCFRYARSQNIIDALKTVCEKPRLGLDGLALFIHFVSRDTYQLDVYKHGGAHVDRYSPQGKLVGRYRLDGTPLRHKGRTPPPIPVADFEKFRAAITGR